MSGLTQVGQDDFGVGVLRGVAPDTQPGVGLYNAVNGLYNDDGDVYRRGGDQYFGSPPPSDDAEPLTFIWTGFLEGQPIRLTATRLGCAYLGTPIPGPGIAAPMNPAVVRNVLYLPNGQQLNSLGILSAWTIPASLPAPDVMSERHVCAAAGRLLVACGNRIAFSTAPPDAFAFNPLDFHELPSGLIVMGMVAQRDTALVFTNYGLWTIANLAYDLTDAAGNPQQTLQLVTPEIGLWHETGLCDWQGGVVAPCRDRVYLIDGVSAPRPISDSIAPLYQRYVNDGDYRPGGAKVFGNHLFLPIIDRAANTPQTLLVCRLSRPARARYVYYPWSIFTGHPAGSVMFDVSLLVPRPDFLAAHSDGGLSSLQGVLSESTLNPLDADFSAYPFDVETRDFPTGNGQPNHVRQVRLRYTVDHGDMGPVTVTAGFSDGPDGTGWDSGLLPEPSDPVHNWLMLGDHELPAPGVGSEPVLGVALWRLFVARRARYARMRFRTENTPFSLVFHRVDMGVRPAAHNR
jgi:hypothetical protein